MQTTANYGLKKPEGNDVVNIDDFNNNADIIDTKMKAIENKAPSAGSADTAGIVKLNNTVTSTSTTEAATANAVRQAYARADSAFQYANNGKTNIANVIGYVAGNNTHQEIANESQYGKNILANNLNSHGVGVNANSALRDLANAVGNISIQSLGGTVLKTISGTLAAGETMVTIPNGGTRIIAAFAEAYGARHGNAAGYIGMSVDGVYHVFRCNYTSSSTTDAIEPSIGTGSTATQIYLTNGRDNYARTYYLLYE